MVDFLCHFSSVSNSNQCYQTDFNTHICACVHGSTSSLMGLKKLLKLQFKCAFLKLGQYKRKKCLVVCPWVNPGVASRSGIDQVGQSRGSSNKRSMSMIDWTPNEQGEWQINGQCIQTSVGDVEDH